MNGWALGGLACFLYTVIIGGLALKKSPGLIKIVKMKLGKKTTDQTAITLSLVMAGLSGIAGIILFITGLSS
ncbi:MAG: hypothetical protein EOM08_03315 [Clostridia bacterium]|nr:hypothetical protein [Clostridia bacterium]NCC75446.1 hypothetical protein [Clostridia bacterium]